MSSVAVAAGADTEATYGAGNTMHFAVTTTGAPGSSKSFTITITNQTDGGVTLDVFMSTTLVEI